jgi:hypothetical protein
MLPMLAVSFADSLDAFDAAVAVNVADRFPTEITTEPGTVTFVLFDESSTSTIPLWAVRFREAVHVLTPPGATVAGLQFTEASTVCDVTVNWKLVVTPVRVAVNVAFTSEEPAVAVNVAEFKPDVIKTEFGILTEPLLLLSAMVIPPEGATPVIVTLQLLVPPGPMTAGLQVKADRLVPAGG